MTTASTLCGQRSPADLVTLKCAALRALAATMGVTGKLETFKVRARASFPPHLIPHHPRSSNLTPNSQNPTQPNARYDTTRRPSRRRRRTRRPRCGGKRPWRWWRCCGPSAPRTTSGPSRSTPTSRSASRCAPRDGCLVASSRSVQSHEAIPSSTVSIHTQQGVADDAPTAAAAASGPCPNVQLQWAEALAHILAVSVAGQVRSEMGPSYRLLV